MKKRIVALLMALSLLASVCVFTANADNPGVTVNSAAELIEALKTENAQITLGSDIVFNEGYTFAYDEENAVITVSDENGTVAKISTGEAEGSTAGAVIEGSLDALTTWAPLGNLNGADLDGAGFAIKGLFVKGAGFTTRIEMGESVKNLKFENTLVISNGINRTGTLASIVIGDVYDVEFKNSYVIATSVPDYYVVGGAIGTVSSTVSGTTTTYNPTIDGISFDGAVFASGVNNVTAGGAIAQNKGGTIMNCENYGTVKVVGGSAYAVGGVVALLEPTTGNHSYGENGAPRDAYLYNLANYGKIVSNKTTSTIAGGVIGKVDVTWSAGEDVIIRNFYNAGKVTNGKELIGSVTAVDGTATIGDTKMEYGFAPLSSTGELCTTTARFAPLSIVKESNDKVLAYLNHGATSVEGLKTWKNDGGVLKMTDTDATYDSSFVAKDITTDTSLEDLVIVSAEVINEKEIKLVFSEEVKLAASVFAGIRYCNAGGGLAMDGETALQYYMGLRGNGSNTVIAKLPDSETKSMADIVSFKGYEDKNYQLMFCIEGLPNDGKFATRIPGELEEIRGVYSGKNLKATEAKAGGIYDDYYIAITGTENASVAFTANTELPAPAPSVMDVNPAPSVSLDPTSDGVKILSAKVINETQIEITFSEAVEKNQRAPFIGIRYTGDALNMIWIEGTPLQFTGGLTLDGTAKGIFNYNPESNGGKTLYDVLSRKGYENSQYSVYLCIEGLPSDYIPEPVAGYIDNVKAVGSDKLLAINLAAANPAYEDYYVPVTGGENAKPAPAVPTEPDFTTPDDGVKIESVKVIDDETMEITFSEEIQKIGSFFHAIRYTNIDLSIRTDPDLTDPNLQFYGSITIEGKKATFKYIADDSRNRGLTFYEVLTMKGYEDKGYFLTYCIEGLASATLIPNPVVGYVDNIASASDPTKLLGSNKPNAGGIYDACYAPIEDIENANPDNNQGGEGDDEEDDDTNSIEVSTYEELAETLASNSNVTIKVTADIVANEGVTYKYDEATGKVVVRNAENAVVAEYGTGKMGTVAGELISGSIESLTKWTALTIENGNTVDFQGHKVSGFVLDSALFTKVDKTATLKNINVENVFAYANGTASARVAVIVASNFGNIDTVNITDAVILVVNCKSANVGMAVGFMNSTKSAGKEDFNPTLNNIKTNGTLIYNATEGSPCIGGIIGKMQGGKLINSVNYADVIHTGSKRYGTGGLIGLAEFDAGQITETSDLSTKTVTNIYVLNNANYGTVDMATGLVGGGLIGFTDLIWSVSSSITLSNNYNSGKVINGSAFVGQRNPISSLGGGTVTFNHLLDNSALGNNCPEFTGVWAGANIKATTQSVALTLLGANAANVDGAWYWKADGEYIVPDKTATAPVTPPPVVDGPDFTTVDGGVKLESVKVIDKVTLELTFSEPIKTVGYVFRGIRYVDKNLNLRTDSTLADKNLQFYGGSLTISGNKATYKFTEDSVENKNMSLYDILTLKGYEDKGYFAVFCFEGVPNATNIPNPTVGYVDNIQSLDGTKALASNKAADTAGNADYERCYAPIQDIENALLPAGGGSVTPPSSGGTVEVATYAELAAALVSKSNAIIKVTADLVANEGVTYKYDEETGKVIIRDANNEVIAEYGTGKMETVAGMLISGSIESLTKWTALTINNGNTVDFQGHKVSGFVLQSGLFSSIDKTGTLKNIEVENVFAYVNGTASAKIGILVADNRGNIDTANITDAIILAANCKSANIGMAIGYMQSAKSAGKEDFNPTANNIRTNGTLIYNAVEGNPCIGGIVGKIQGGKITNSVNSADVIHTGTASYGTGGLVGLAEFDSGVINAGDNLASKTVTNIYIINCANYGTVEVQSGMHGGGLVGYADLIWSASSTFTINNCYSGGKLINCKSSFIARSQKPTANGGGTVSCNYLFANSALRNPYSVPTGTFACEVVALGVQEYILECLNSNVARLTAINGDESIFAWAWVEDNGILVPDKEAEIPEAGPVPPPPPVDPAEPDFTTTEGGVKIESVVIVDHETLEVTFSEAVKKNGNFFIALRYVDASFTLMTDSTLKDPNLQFYAKSTTIDGNKLTFVYDPSKHDEKTLYDILTYKGYENLGYLVTFCIEGLANESIPEPVVGYVDNIVSATDPTKLLAANKTSAGGVFDACYAPIEGDVADAFPPQAGENTQEPTVDMTPTEGGITVESAKVINETQIEITFSEPVQKVGSVFSAIRYTNSSLKLMQDLILEDPNLQFYSPLKFDENDKTKAVYTYTPTDNRTLYDILDRRGYETKYYFVYFCIEGLPSESIPEPKVGYIDNIQSLDGTKLLASNKPTSAAGIYDGYYIPIENGNTAMPEGHQIKPWYDINALSAKVLNEREIEVTFDKGALSSGSVFAGIRYVDNNNNLIWIDGQPLQFTGGLRINGTEKGIFTLSATANTLTMEEILAFKGYEDKGYKVKLCFEGLPGPANPLYGYIDNIQTYDGRGMLVANKPATNKIYDGIYLEIEDQENCTVEFTEATPLPTPDIPLIPIDPDILTVPSDSIKILEARVINSTQIKIVFSEAVQRVGSTFNAIRYVDRSLNLKYENGQPLQWWSNTTVVEGNTITFSWENTSVSMKDVINKKGFETSGYYVMFCFEGLPASSIKNPKQGYIDNITSKNGKKLLGANKPTSAAGIYDGVYVNITGLENINKPGPRPGWVDVKNRPYLTLLSAKVINPSQIELIFSEPIKTQGGMFTAIRYTNKEYGVQRDESLKDPYLQFTGGLAVDGTERAIWTLSGSSSKTLYELLNMKGYEKKGYYVYFCIEGLPSAPTKEPGYIDNIASLDGKKLLQCTRSKASAGGVYDGLYVKIEDVEKAVPIEVPELEGIFVDQIELVTPYKLELVFSEPIYIVGMGNEATQFQAVKASIRYVDPKTYETITYNDRIMQFTADFYIEDGDTIGTFEIRDQDTTVIDIFNMVGYEDLKEKAIPVLCLEGTADMSVLPTPYPGYVDNIQNQDGTNMLTAMIAHGGGVADVWLATADEIKLEVRKTEIELLKELVATDKMTSAELEAFAAMDEASLKETLTKAKELLEALKSGEMTETGVTAFNELLAKNGIDNAEKVKAMMFTVGETYDVGLPMLINLDVSEREYDWSDTVYVYRVNADGSIVEIAQRNLTVYVADEIITRIEFADSVLGDYFVTNSHLELPTPFNPAIIAYIAIGVMALALIVLVIFLASKKKKEKNA